MVGHKVRDEKVEQPQPEVIKKVVKKKPVNKVVKKKGLFNKFKK